MTTAQPTDAPHDGEVVRMELEEAQTKRILPLPTEEETIELTAAEVEAMQETKRSEKTTRNKRWLLSSSTDFTPLAVEMGEYLTADRKNAAQQNQRLKLVVLPNISAPVTLLNIGRLLGDGVFVRSETVHEPRKPFVDVDGDGVVFRFVDRVAEMQKEDWDHVCAAFLVGQAWQFKGWPFAGPAEVVERLRCFYVALDGAEVPSEPWMAAVVVLHIATDDKASWTAAREKCLEELRKC